MKSSLSKGRWLIAVASHCFVIQYLNSFAWASEGGGSSYPMGAEAHMMGALPPPGLYAQVFSTHYEAHRLRDNSGDRLPVDFRLRVNVVAPRLIWVSEQQLMGGSLAFHVLVPFADVRVELGKQKDSKRGLGDIIFGPVIGFHHSEKFHSAFALDIITPTGRYDRNDLANTGRNYWAIEPVMALTYIDPHGFNADAKFMYDFNFKNQDTDYRSGQEFHIDYDLGWGMGNGWVVGVGGYALWQTTDDRQHGERVDDNKGRAFAIGPSVKYASDNGWFVSLKWQKESQVRNRPEGDAFWLKLTMPL